MSRRQAPTAEFEIGAYVCPKTKESVPLTATQSVSDLCWPVVVEKCPACGQRHEIQYSELRHPPVFGYE